jgi:hypothetical protein
VKEKYVFWDGKYQVISEVAMCQDDVRLLIQNAGGWFEGRRRSRLQSPARRRRRGRGGIGLCFDRKPEQHSTSGGLRYYTRAMSKHLESLYQNLLHGKLPHNLSWSETVELVEHLGEVQPHGDDEFVFRVGSQRVLFKRPHTHDLGVEEVSRLRKFLKEAGTREHTEKPAKSPRMIVVIDHHAAHVYQDLGGSQPADEDKVQPYDPFNFHHHLIHRKEAHYRGERIPEEYSFYEEVAKDLTPANEIVLIGHATGKSNAADFLKEYLQTHHPDISRRVVATESADLSAVTESQVEALAKRHMIAA